MNRIPFILLALALAPIPARAALTPGPDGGWIATQPGYTAAINAQGYLSSFKAQGVEAVGEPLSYTPNAILQRVPGDDNVEGSTLRIHLKGKGEAIEAILEYAFRPEGFTLTTTWKGPGFADFHVHASNALLGIELLNNKSVTVGGEATHFVDHGEVRGVPALPSSRNQMVRFHFPGFNLHAYVQAWGAPFNYESAGEIRDRSWGRVLMDSGKPFPIVFTLEPANRKSTLPSLPFAPRSTKVASLYYVGEPCVWNIDLGEPKAYQYLRDAGITKLNLEWRLEDFHDRPVGAGKAILSLNTARTMQPVTIRVPGSGYYHILFRLSEPSGRMLPGSFLTRFTCIHRVPGLTNRDDSLAGKPISDYAVMAMIGVGGIRESHNMGDFFTNQAPAGADWVKIPDPVPADAPVWMNTRSLDALFAIAQSESQKYHLTYFFQANSRPAYATPTVYEAMAYALVDRYKDRCHTWEVENEPNFRYSPANYVDQALAPFARGAKRADPGCVVMGPGCVSLKQTLEFMQYIYAHGANRYVDNVSTHTYPGPGESWEQFGNLATITELKEWMKAHGDGGKAIWQTEQGYAWDNAPQGQAARYAVRQFLQGWRLGIRPNHQYYFYPHWHGFEDWYLQGSGEVGSEESWLPGAAALRFLAENTAGMEYAGDIPSPYKGIYLARFSGPTGDTIAAWTFDFPTTIRVRTAAPTRAVDFMGNPLALKRDRSRDLLLPLSGEPLYLHLPRGAAFRVAEPPLGPNRAAASTGAVADASSADAAHPASFANDGNWNLWENVIGIPGRTAWQSAHVDPTPAAPDWLEITFPRPELIDRMVALCYLPAVNPSPRDFLFQVESNGAWRTVASGKDEFTWVLERQFAPVQTRKIRMVIAGINDGWHGDRRWMHVLMGPQATHYTDSKVLVSELEAYGPPRK